LNVATVALAGANPGQYVESNDLCSGQALAANGRCTVEVAFAPTATGTQNATLDISSDAPTSPDSVALTGTGGQSAVSASPESQDFGKYSVGKQSPPQTFTITNTGTATLNITSADLVGAAAGEYALSNDQCSGQSVAPTESCTVDVAFSPVYLGPKQNASLEITSDAPSSPDDLSLTGQAIGPAKWLACAFRVRHLRMRSNGLATFDLTVPGKGVVNVMESASNRGKQPPPLAAAEPVPPSRPVLGRARLVVRARGKFHLKVPAGEGMRSLIAHHRQTVRVRLWVTFTSRNEPPLLVGVYNLVVTT
jgi:hypothetical protein